MTPAQKSLYTISEAAKLLGVSAVTLRLWERQGKITSTRTAGGQRRYTPGDLEVIRQMPHSRSAALIPEIPTPKFQFQINPSQKRVLFGSLIALVISTLGFITARSGILPSPAPLISSFQSLFSKPTAASVVNQVKGAVLASQTTLEELRAVFNVVTLFKKDVTIEGQLTAPNIIYSLTAGDNITITAGQTPTISATDQTTSLGIFKTIKVGGTSFSAGSNTDTLTFAAGDNASVSINTTDKKITFSASTPTSPGWTDDGTLIRLTTAGDLVSIGSATGAAKLSIENNTSADLFTASQSGNLLAKLDYNGLFNLAATGFNAGLKLQNSTILFSGAGAPSDANGNNGDYYFRTDGTGNTSLYTRVSGSWIPAGGGSTTLQDAYDNGKEINFSAGAILLKNGSTTVTTLNISGITTTGIASVAGQLTLSSSSTLQTTSNRSLILGGDTTGNIVFSPLAGAIAANVSPSTDAQVDLGTASNRWRTIYAGNLITGGSGTIGLWQRALGVVSPDNITDDLTIGGTATSSALFQVSGTTGNVTIAGNTVLGNAVASDTVTYNSRVASTIEPSVGSTYDLGSSARRWATVYGDTGNFTNFSSSTTTISGTTSNDFLINTDNATADTEDASLTFERGSPVTNVQFKWNSTDKVLYTNSPTFSILGDTGIAYSGRAALIVDQVQAQDILTASASGVAKFTVSNAGNLTLAGNVVTTSTSGIQGWWQRALGAVAPTNITDDLLVGGTATASALFQISGTTGNASTSGTLTFGSTATIATTSKRSLTLGDTNTGNIIFSGGNVGIGTTGPSGKLNVDATSGNILNLTSSGVSKLTVDTNGTLISSTSVWVAATGGFVFSNQSQLLSPSDGIIKLANYNNNGFTRLDFGGTTSSFPALAVNGSDLQVIRADGSTNANLLVTGNVGIGTTSPLAKLDVNGTASVSGALSLYGTPTIATTAKQSLTLGDSNTGNIIFSGGNVGIGTTGPGAKLDVRGGDIYFPRNNSVTAYDATNVISRSLIKWLSASDTLVFGGESNGQDIYFGSATAPFARFTPGADDSRLEIANASQKTWYLMNEGSSGAYMANGFIIRNNTDAVNALAITNAGNVGIGTTNPVDKLYITGAESVAYLGVAYDTSLPNLRGVFRHGGNANGILNTGGLQIAAQGANNASLGSGKIVFFTTAVNSAGGNIDATYVERMRITHDGNVGIGTTAPDAALEINHATGDSLRLTYNDSNGSATNFTDFSLDSTGGLTLTGSAASIASGASAEKTFLTLTPANITLTGTTQVTAVMDTYQFNRTTIAGDTATVTVDDAATLTIAGPPAEGSNVSLTEAYALKINTAATTATTAYGLYVDAPTGAGANYAAIFMGGNVGVGTTALLNEFNVAGAATVSSSLALGVQSGPPVTCNAANEGRLFYHGTSVEKKLYYCNGTSWTALSSGIGGESSLAISPEYPGAVISADGTNNVGTLTSDREATGAASLYNFNYYEFASGQTSLQDYDVYVRFRIPDNFSSWVTSDALIVDFETEDTSSANNKVDATVYKDNDADTISSNTNVSNYATTWHAAQLSSHTLAFTAAQLNTGITWAAGDVMTVKLKLYSKDNYFARIGTIKLDWQ